MRTKHTFRLPPDLAGKLADYAHRKRVPQALVVETALASLLSPDGADRLEAALARRLDRMTRQIQTLERHVTITNEALALFVRFWLTSTPPLPDTAQAAAQTNGRAPAADPTLRRIHHTGRGRSSELQLGRCQEAVACWSARSGQRAPALRW